MNDRQALLAFLRSQRVVAIASHDKEPWIANVYYCVDDDYTLYFVSDETRLHSKQILKRPTIAFSVVWYNPKRYTDRKGVQGAGVCRPAKTVEENRRGLELHNATYPVFAKAITAKWINAGKNHSRVWVIKPKHIKFWNDAQFGQDGSHKITF